MRADLERDRLLRERALDSFLGLRLRDRDLERDFESFLLPLLLRLLDLRDLERDRESFLLERDLLLLLERDRDLDRRPPPPPRFSSKILILGSEDGDSDQDIRNMVIVTMISGRW